MINAELPRQRVFHTEWFHVDCLANYYRVKPYSEEHWRIIGNFIRLAAARSINTLLEPLSTPLLDIAEGFERTNDFYKSSMFSFSLSPLQTVSTI